MAIERLAPDAILASSNLNGVVTDIQDDPDSPDSNWLTTQGNNDNGFLRVSFPTPSVALVPGAGLQEFRLLLRKNNSGGNAVGLTITLRENNTVRATLGTISGLSDTPTVFSYTFDSSSLAASSGEDVEVYVDQTSGGSGGSPAGRRWMEVGAIEWNADVVVPVAAAVTATVTTTAAIAVQKTVASSVSASAITAGSASVGKPLSGSETISAVSSAGLEAYSELPQQPYTAEFNGAPYNELVFNGLPLGGQTQDLTATETTTATTSAALGVTKTLSSSVTATVTSSGALGVVKQLASSAQTSAATAASIGVTKSLAGSASAQASAVGSVSITKPLSLSVTASATASAPGLSLTQVLGSSISVSANTAAASLAKSSNMSSAVTATVTSAGAATVTKPLAAAATTTATTAGNVRKAIGLAGSVSSTVVTAGNLRLQVNCASAVSIQASSSGSIQLAKPLAVAATVTAALSANASVDFKIAANASVFAQTNGNLGLTKGLSGASSGQATTSGFAGIQINASGTALTLVAVNGVLVSSNPIDVNALGPGAYAEILDSGFITADAQLEGADAEIDVAVAFIGEIFVEDVTAEAVASPEIYADAELEYLTQTTQDTAITFKEAA
jgi:hypothetical protein